MFDLCGLGCSRCAERKTETDKTVTSGQSAFGMVDCHVWAYAQLSRSSDLRLRG